MAYINRLIFSPDDGLKGFGSGTGPIRMNCTNHLQTI